MNESTVCSPQEGGISGPCGNIEFIMTCPKEQTLTSIYGIICHPHPLYGGTMTNKVVHTIAQSFNALGVGAVRFNFRGVGKSEGQYDEGRGESEDLRAVAHWLHTHYQPEELWLAGFSFGSYVALKVHQELKAKRLLLVAPAVERFDFTGLHLSNLPTLIIQGGQDQIVSPDAVSAWVAKQSYPPEFKWIMESDHFFHGKLLELRKIIRDSWEIGDH